VLANCLSLYRIPAGLLLWLLPATVPWRLFILLSAAASDILDGWVARRIGRVTALGALLDPFADKVFACSAVALLWHEGLLNWLQIAFLASRELSWLLYTLCWIPFGYFAKIPIKLGSVLTSKLFTALQLALVSMLLLGLQPSPWTWYLLPVLALLAALEWLSLLLHSWRSR